MLGRSRGMHPRRRTVRVLAPRWWTPADHGMDPGKLAGLLTAPAKHLVMTRAVWKAGGNKADEIRVQAVNGSTYSDHVYDPKTGLCVLVASCSLGARPKLVGPGDFGRGDTTITPNDHVNSRDVMIPWTGEPAPDWVRSIRTLHYRRSLTAIIVVRCRLF
jgi:hypothetical protein